MHQGEQARALASPSTIQPKDMTTSKIVTDTATNELIRYAITAWGCLVRWDSRLTLVEFAAAIRRHSSHARAEALTVALESTIGFVVRDWRGFHANWQC